MALNRPTAEELLAILREFLERDVAPQVTGATAFNLRIAGNVLALVERELAQRPAADAAERDGLRDLLGSAADGEAGIGAMNAALVADIRAGAFDEPADRARLLSHLRVTTAAKLAIDNPKWAKP